MKFPSKVTPYKESIIAKFPVVLGKLEKKDMSPSELYKSVKRQVTDIREFMDIMDCLYALKKVELNGEVICQNWMISCSNTEGKEPVYRHSSMPFVER